MLSLVLEKFMARKKEYIEQEVIEKAMNLFWRNGYETTSTRMLEKEMGINQFSIYSSFGNKHGVFLKSLKLYKRKLNLLLNKLEKSTIGKDGIKQYFYDFMEFSRENELRRGCLLVNTVIEFGEKMDEMIMSDMQKYAEHRQAIFIQNLKFDTTKDVETISIQANYLAVAILGLAAACKVYERKQLEDFIETTFENI